MENTVYEHKCCYIKTTWQRASSSTSSQPFIFCLEQKYKHLPLFVWPQGGLVQMERVSGSIWTRTPWDQINRGKCLYTYTRHNINGCVLVFEEARCHIALRSRRCKKNCDCLIYVFYKFNILMIPVWAIGTGTGVLDLEFFVQANSLRIALRRWNM
jgi:hypothetical protein